MGRSNQGTPATRDARVDLLRGLALLMIFVDHGRDNGLANITLHNFGLADAAELFVIFSGFSAMTAYGRIFARDGVTAGMRKILARCLKLYGFQVALLLATFCIVKAWTEIYGFQPLIMGPLIRDGVHGAVRGLMLEALPTYLDILPLYLVLMLAFPLIYLGFRLSPAATLAVSIAVYAAANVWHLDLPNVMEPGTATQWYFNPFTWQIVFVLGAFFAYWCRAPRSLPKSGLLTAICWGYVFFALIAAAPWGLWPHSWVDSLPMSLFGNDSKSYVSPWRLADALALVYLALTSAKLERIAVAGWTRSVLACGRHSLEVFALGSLLALLGRLLFRTLGTGWPIQSLVNIIGLTSMILLGILLDAKLRPKKGANARTYMPPLVADSAVQLERQ